MAEGREQLFERASGRLRMPPVEEWETFPFARTSRTLRALAAGGGTAHV